MRYILKYFLISLILYLLSLIFISPINAQNFQNDYQVEYFLSESQDNINTRVKFTITITNLASDLYVKKFSIGFPSTFQIKNIKGYDDHREITPQVDSSDDATKISLEFSDPDVGKNSVNNLYLEFDQDNLFKINGNVWEVILPTVENKENGSYKILLHLPSSSDKKIAISKPIPDYVSGNVITWNNPKVKTIYAVFGAMQYYQTELTYHLENSKLIPVYTDIAFPPDTQYQKIYVTSIHPPPSEVSIDSDGNYIGRYVLQPRQSLAISFSGIVAEFASPREEVIPYIRESLVEQKQYLLSPQTLWQISSVAKISELDSNPQSIYQFVTRTLTYDYDKINSDNKRLGAEAVLNNPNQAVCMEFTDLFVGIARQKGLFAREIEGYGFSDDPKLRPLSLTSDILHSWPEYFDERARLWIPVDPTWENTSGIDYFSSFDLNHITFAIHAKDQSYPPPAGTYKVGNSRDVTINPTSLLPQNRLSLSVTNTPLEKEVNDSETNLIKIDVENKGNIYYWGKGISVTSSEFVVTASKSDIAPLPPYAKTTVMLRYKAKDKVSSRTSGEISILLPNGRSISEQISIVPFYYTLAVNMSVALGICALIILTMLYFKRRRNSVKSLN